MKNQKINSLFILRWLSDCISSSAKAISLACLAEPSLSAEVEQTQHSDFSQEKDGEVIGSNILSDQDRCDINELAALLFVAMVVLVLYIVLMLSIVLLCV